MIVCDNPAFVGYLPPKTGCVSTVETLRENFPARLARNSWHDRVAMPSMREHFHFLIVRNPFPRAVSWWWHYKTVDLSERSVHPGKDKSWRPAGWPTKGRRAQYELVKPMSFRDFVLHKVTRRLLLPCMVWRRAMIRCDAILRNETLAEDFASLPFTDGIELHRYNVGRGSDGYGDWQDHYDAEIEGVIRDLFRDDFREFGYNDRI